MISTSRARCRICNEEITFTIGNPVELGFHMIDRHSSGSVVQYSIHEEDKICPARRSSGGKCSGGCLRRDGQEPGAEKVNAGPDGGSGGGVEDGGGGSREETYKGMAAGGPSGRDEGGKQKKTNGWDTMRKLSSGKKVRRKRRSKGLYKTTLETWTAGGCYMICPGCKKEVKPLIKTQKNKVAFTSLGATFLLSCWPFCFLFPLHHKCSVDLYCPNCKTKLGMYDTNTGTYHTNGDVVMSKERVPNISRKQ